MLRRTSTVLWFAGCLVLSVPAGGQQDETAVKAGFVYNFAQFIEWPAKEGPLTFCVVGEPALGRYLKENVAGKTLGKRPLAVQAEAEADASKLAGCEVIYLGRKVRKDAERIAAAMAGRQVLVVSDDPALGEHGVAINFYLDEERVRFEINRRAVDKLGLRISSRLMSLARVKE